MFASCLLISNNHSGANTTHSSAYYNFILAAIKIGVTTLLAMQVTPICTFLVRIVLISLRVLAKPEMLSSLSFTVATKGGHRLHPGFLQYLRTPHYQ